MFARHLMKIFALAATCIAVLSFGSAPVVGAQVDRELVRQLRRNLYSYYEDIPLCIEQCTETIDAAEQTGHETILAIARMQRSAAILRDTGFDDCRPDFEQSIHVRINSDDPELLLLYEIARTTVEHEVYSKSDCVNQLRDAANAAADTAHSDVLFAAEFELASRSAKSQLVAPSIQYVSVRMTTQNLTAINRESAQEQFLSVLRQPTTSNILTGADELNRGVFYRTEILSLPDSLRQTGAARRFQFEACLLAATMLQQNGELKPSLETLIAAREIMQSADDLSAMAQADVRIGIVQHRLWLESSGRDTLMESSARDSLISAAERMELITARSALTQLLNTGSQIRFFSQPSKLHRTGLSSAVEARFQKLKEQDRWMRDNVPTFRELHNQTLLVETAEARERYLLLTGLGLVPCIGLAVFLLRDRWRLRKLNSQLHGEILARVKAAEERERLELHLAQSARLESLGALAGGIAHDFNNLLVGVLGNAELLRYSEDISERAAEYLNGITTAAETAADLSRKMLAYAGKQQAKKTAVEVNQLVQRMLPLFRSGAGAQHKVEFFPSVHPVYTEADEGQLEQILLNLVTNAVHAMSNRIGTIQIRIGFEYLEQISAESSLYGNRRDGGDFVWFEITDCGRGIPEEHLTRMFEPFYTTKDHAQSHGFGLAIVYGHVNRHDGLIRLTSTKDVGTTFRVLLPRLSEFRTERLRVNGDSSSHSQPKFVTAVIVDDQLPVLQFVERLFQANDWSAHCFLSASEALEFLSEGHAIDCLLIDLMMPGVSGISMLEELEQRGSEIPAILMSGFSETNMQELLRFRCVSSVLEKPFRPIELVTAISAAMSQSAGRVPKPIHREH